MTNSSKIDKNAAKKIKAFQYLDTEKMYSISSQIFEGLTDYVLNSKHNSKQETETQKGREWGDGRVLADIIEESSGTTEKRFLHDYSYTLFENALIEADRVLEINESNIIEKIGLIDEKSFIKVTGKILFNDINSVIHSLKNFNDFGYAVWFITGGQEMVKQYKETKKKIVKTADRNKKAVALSRVEGIANFESLIEEQGLFIDPDRLELMAYLLDYGYDEQFEVQLPLTHKESNWLFSAQLKREMLKESESLIIKKYSRETEKRFTIFGIPTQSQGEKLDSKLLVEGETVLKQAMMNFVSSLTKLENTFTGSLSYEYVIDPIAVYLEI